ncbi:DUF2997 domain-containing protein [Planktothrix agardhii]|uniref:DUF2997 domain-containing protein n=1 Tax=Planktothrix agardhii TaxID=1160 RepID=UPI0020A6E5B8|nr:DUF2997 domain-containing protein [Planktothrix agardhii]CAD5911701.1 hypothetical protein NO758_00083 [Planktothrix agardhii]
MAEYQKVEYRIGKDGKITEKVIEGHGSNCVDATTQIESALGTIESQELLPEYYQDQELISSDEIQRISQG